jgi:hypothetical protein
VVAAFFGKQNVNDIRHKKSPVVMGDFRSKDEI